MGTIRDWPPQKPAPGHLRPRQEAAGSPEGTGGGPSDTQKRCLTTREPFLMEKALVLPFPNKAMSHCWGDRGPEGGPPRTGRLGQLATKVTPKSDRLPTNLPFFSPFSLLVRCHLPGLEGTRKGVGKREWHVCAEY